MSASQEEIPPPPPPPPSSQTPTQQTPHTPEKEEEKQGTVTLLDGPIQKIILLRFHKMTDAKDKWMTSNLDFGEMTKSKKMQTYILKQHLKESLYPTPEGASQRIKGTQDNRRRDAWNSGNKDGSRTGQKEDSKAMVTIDGEGVDWTNHLEDEDYDHPFDGCKQLNSAQRYLRANPNRSLWYPRVSSLTWNPTQIVTMLEQILTGNPQQEVVNLLAGDSFIGNAKSRPLWLLLLQKQSMLLLQAAVGKFCGFKIKC
ncbi:hypothetical protein Tco_0320629 [Tanacetum coccineum]